MRRLVALAAATLLTVGLLAPGRTATAGGCPDPGQLLEAVYPFPDDVALGATATQTIGFAVQGYEGCLVAEAPPEVRILTPHREFFVELQRDEAPYPGWFQYSGSFVIDPARLVAEDAGSWLASYEVMGTRYDEHRFPVRRATHLAFDAGPEPVRRSTIEYRGTLLRADWEAGRERAYRGEELEILALDPVRGVQVPNVAIARPGRDGTYYVRQRFPGTNRYQARFAGDGVSATSTSDVDEVTAG